MATRTLLTEADFDALPRKEGNVYELSQGELVVTASPRLRHNLVRDFLGESLRIYCRKSALGIVVSETEFRLSTSTVRIPDLAFLRTEHLRSLDVDQRIEISPDLAVEVVSPSNDAIDLIRKVRQYLQAGTQLVWVIYPEIREVHIYRPGQAVQTRDDRQYLDAPEVLPGWNLALAELFNAGQL